MPFSAEQWLKSKKLTPANAAQRAQAQADGFFVAGMARLDLLSDIKTALEDSLKQGTPLRDFQKQLVPHLVQKGWLQGQGGAKVIPHRLKVIYETNVRMAYHAGQWGRIERRAKLMPYLIYRLGPSQNHRPQHQAWAGVTLKVNHPFWQVAAPPNGFGCKCRLEQVSRRGLEAIKAQGGIKEPSLGNQRIALQEPKTKKEIARILKFTQKNGVFHYEGIEKGFESNMGRFQAVRMAQVLAAKASGFFGEDSKARDHYLAQMTQHPTRHKAFEQFVLHAKVQPGASQPIGYFQQTEKNVDEELDLREPIWMEAALIAFGKAHRHGGGSRQRGKKKATKDNALSLQEWQSLSFMIANPDGLYFDNRHSEKGDWIFVKKLKNGEAIKIVVSGKTHQVRTAFKAVWMDIAGSAKGGLITKVR